MPAIDAAGFEVALPNRALVSRLANYNSTPEASEICPCADFDPNICRRKQRLCLIGKPLVIRRNNCSVACWRNSTQCMGSPAQRSWEYGASAGAPVLMRKSAAQTPG